MKKKITSHNVYNVHNIVQLYCLEEDIEESTSHYVQLEDGTYAEMVEGHEIVAPGEQMLVKR